MPKRIARHMVNLLWRSTALAILIAALMVTIGREMLPRIDLESETLARMASERTKSDIHFENLHGQWVQLMPELSASAVSIRSHDLDIQMNKVKMQINILRSLLERTVVFDRLEINSATINYHLPGNNPAIPDTKINADDAWHIIFALLRRNVQIQNVDLAINKDDQTTRLHMQDFRVEQTLLHKKIFLRVLGNDGKESLNATGTLSGNAFSNSTGRFYVNVGDWSLQEWLPATTTADTLPPLLQALRNAPWHAGGELWIDWQGATVDAFADVTLSNPDHGDRQLERLHTQLSGKWSVDQQEVSVHRLDLQQNNQSTRLLEAVNIQHRLEQWHIQAPVLRLTPLLNLVDYLPPEGQLHDLLTSLKPTGELLNLDLIWNTNKPLLERMRLRANANNLATGAWHGVPAFTNVSGYLDSGVGYGFIDLDSQHGFSMHYPEIYHEPLSFDRAAGRVQWQWLREEHTVLVGSDYASLSVAEEEARGSFLLHLPLQGATFKSDMYLAIGLQNSQAHFRDKYLPYILPQSLLNWLKNSIGDAAIPDAGFIFRGPLSGHEHTDRAIQFYANVHDGDIQFDPNWPRLTGLNGKVLVDDNNTVVRTFSGKMYGTAIVDAQVQALAQDNGLIINVNAIAKGSAADGLRVIQETPLHTQFGNAFDSWRVTQGNLETRLQLTIPLLGSPEPSAEDVRCQLFNTTINLEDLRLPIEKLSGGLSYHSVTGLTSPRLDATLFDEPIALTINSQKTPTDLSVTLQGDSKIASNKLADWSKLTPLGLLSGDIDYAATLKLGPFGKNSTDKIGALTLNSNMKNITLPLPVPFTKQTGDIKPLTMTVDILRNNHQDYRLNYNKQVDGSISMRNGTLFSGVINVTDGIASNTAPSPVAGPLRIIGQLPEASVTDWATVISAYNQLAQSHENTTTLYPEFNFFIGKLTLANMTFPATKLDVIHSNNNWRVTFDGEKAKGIARFYDQPTIAGAQKNSTTTQLPDVALDTLKIDSPESTSSSESTSNINFADVPSMKFSLEHFIYNGMDIGNIALQLESTPSALQFHSIRINGPGYAIKAKKSGDNASEGAEFAWRLNPDGLYQSEFHGLLHMQDEQPALTHLGIDPFVRGKNIYLSGDIAWRGSPLQFQMTSLYGQIDARGEYGKYFQAKPNVAMQAINVLDIATWVRRLRLDFSDLKNDGISFDKFKGALSFNNGVMEFSEPLHVQSPSSSIKMAGKAFLDTGQLDLKLIATLPVGNNATWIAALAGGLPAAAGVYLVSKVFSDQLETITSLSYTITGAMSDPAIAFDRIAPPKLDSKPTNAKP